MRLISSLLWLDMNYLLINLGEFNCLLSVLCFVVFSRIYCGFVLGCAMRYMICLLLFCRYWYSGFAIVGFGSMAMNERKTIDLEQGWEFMQKGITKLKNILEGLPEPQFSSEDYMMLYT